MAKLYTCVEIAERYSVKPRTVWDWVRNEKISAIKIGKSYRFTEEDILAFEKSKKTMA